jgi:hypothetical protein
MFGRSAAPKSPATTHHDAANTHPITHNPHHLTRPIRTL